MQGIYNDVATFGFSFLILITMWLRYTRIMSVFPLEGRGVINLNIALLFCVSIEPFLFNIIRNAPEAVTDRGAYLDATSTLFALDLAALFGILGIFTLTLASEDRKLIPKALTKAYKFEGGSWLVCAALFAISALPLFFMNKADSGDPIRYYFWLLPLVLIWLSRRFQRWMGATDGNEV